MNAVELSLFANRIAAVCDEMGAVLRRSAFSPNIKDRLDFSCAVFDAQGRLGAQAAHIPVHLGSMAYAMRAIVDHVTWQQGDMLILNDPYLGGTHLPDVTVVAPVYCDSALRGFVVNRAHHADVGCETPGSMPLATTLAEEGLIVSPQKIVRAGVVDEQVMEWLLKDMRNRQLSHGDFTAQLSANLIGCERLADLIDSLPDDGFAAAVDALNDYGDELAAQALRDIPAGTYSFCDVLDADGHGATDIPIQVTLTIDSDSVHADFTGSAAQVRGNLNCPISVAAAAVYYAFYCLMPRHTPHCDGSFRRIRISAPANSVINASAPAAVAAGNVETSSRIVDTVLGALAAALPERIPAASQGTMNNIAMGSAGWDYYETLGGGLGAHANGRGPSAQHSHMTNTLNTPIEVLELNYPLRVRRYAIRANSGGRGQYHGGNGLIREYEFLAATEVTLIGERRQHPPWGLAGGAAAQPGRNSLNGRSLPGKVHFHAQPGDRLRIATPGGGGWGASRK